ncbi:MAG: haloalkane dehalogenase [Microthrixaceae bacterium]
MDVLRTPDARFEGLPDWPYEPHYTEVVDPLDGTVLRIARVEEGPAGAAPVLCLHGEPSWSYLYRHMIPVLTSAGHRVVAPDLVGFGRSDKPAERTDYTYARHVAWMSAWLEAEDLRGITLVCQDWGGLIGLRLATAYPDRFDRLVVANTFLPTGDRDPGDGFRAWREFSQSVPEFDCGAIVDMGSTSDLSPEVVAAYNAPFPDQRHVAGARQFPTLVPATPDDPESGPNRAAWEVLEAWDRPVLCAFSDRDPVTGGADRVFLERVPGTAGQPHTTIEGGGHFLQEDRGPELARVVVDFIAATPVR